MTDKQIIIDGIDVSGCSYGEIEKSIFKCSCEYNVRSASMFCKDNPNCYYKQYKLKEQECEELKRGYAELTETVSPYMDDFTGYNEELGGFDLALCVKELMEQLDQLKAENERLEKKLKEVKNVLSESFSLWMFHIANGVGNSSNANVHELLEDFAVAIRLLADTLGESEAFLSYTTNDSEVYKHRKDLLQKMNEVCNEKKL